MEKAPSVKAELESNAPVRRVPLPSEGENNYNGHNKSLIYRQRIYSKSEFLSLCMSFAKDCWKEFATKSPFDKQSLRDELN